MSLKKKKKRIEDPWKENKRLEEENKRLVDENASLWFLLDEFEKSNVFNKEHRDELNETFEKLRKVVAMTHSKVEEA